MKPFRETGPAEAKEEGGNFFTGRMKKRNEISVPVPIEAMGLLFVT